MTSDSLPHKAPGKNRRWFVELVLLAAFVLFLRVTYWGTIVQGWMQRGVLATGLFTPQTEFDEAHAVQADLDFGLVRLESEGPGERDRDEDSLRKGLQNDDDRDRSLHWERIAFDMSSLEGKVVFLNLWATWCAPCLAEMPTIQKLYDRIDDPDIAFVMLSSDGDWDSVQRFIERTGYTFPIYRPTGNLPLMFDTGSVPTTWVIRPDGRMVTVHSGMANYNSEAFRRFLLDLRAGPRP